MRTDGQTNDQTLTEIAIGRLMDHLYQVVTSGGIYMTKSCDLLERSSAFTTQNNDSNSKKWDPLGAPLG